MKRYETIFIADPDLSQEVRDNLFEKTQALISTNGGDLVELDEWGNRRLAYEVRKKMRGHYVRLDYCGDGAAVSALENAFRIDERVFKFMTILLENDADPEQLKAALAEKQAAKEAAAAETAVTEAPETTSAATPETAPEAAPEAAPDEPAKAPEAAPENTPETATTTSGETPAETTGDETPDADSAEAKE